MAFTKNTQRKNHGRPRQDFDINQSIDRQTFGQSLGLGRAGSPQTRNATRDPQPWIEGGGNLGGAAGIRSAGRQVGLSPSHAGHRDGRGWDDPGGDACLGPPRPKSPPDGLTAETSARRRWLRTRLHRGCSRNPSGIQGGQPFSSTVRFLRRDRGPGASEDRCHRRFCVGRHLGQGSRRCGLPLAHPQVAGGVLQHLLVVAFQEVRAGEGGVDGGTRIVGQAVGQDRVGRGLFQDCQSRLRA